ncbi:MAG: glycosyltransferase family 39 protein [Candidatus Omnitrophota bacterium]|nr:MAG: glycosyltransferase family 39 protein [Candidatus Omnitrophota bacterium]
MRGIYTLFTTKKSKLYLWLFLFCLVLYLPASFLRAPIPPDEVRSIHIAQNMDTFRAGIIPQYLGEPYYEKPPLYFWVLKGLLTISKFNYLFFPTLFNILVSWAILSLNYRFFKRKGQGEIGLYSCLFLATTAIFYGMSVLLRMDILFLLFIFLSIFYFWKDKDENKVLYLVLSGAFSFLAVFTKGALGIVFPLFIEIVMSLLVRDRKSLGKALVVNLGVVVVSFLWIFSFSKADPLYFKKMVLDQTFSRGFGQTQHPFLRVRGLFYYLPFLFLLFLPWSFLGIGYFSKLKREKLDFWEKVYLWWFWGGFVILSLLRSKMEMYLLLLSIPICALTAKFFLQGEDRFKRKLLLFTAGFFTFVVAAGFIYSKIAAEFIPGFAPWVLVIFLAGFICMLKKPATVQFKNFLVSWVLFLQIANLLALPLVAEYSELKKIVDKLDSLDVAVDKVYCREKLHLLLPSYDNFKKEIVHWKKMTCPPDSCVLISVYEATQCRNNQLAKVGVNYFYYNKK